MALEQGNRRQEAVALQTMFVQAPRRQVGGGDQGCAGSEQVLQELAEDHGVADVGDGSSLEAETTAPRAKLLRHPLQRVGGAGVRTQGLVDAAHEAMEMQAQFAFHRQAVVQQVDQESLAATNATVQIQAPHRRLGAKARQETLPERGLGARQQLRVDAVEHRQQRALCRVLLALSAIDLALVGGGWIHASGGSSATTPAWIAARSSGRRPWKKCDASAKRTSVGAGC